MNQTTRNKIALALSVVLVPTMIYLMVTNIRKAKEVRHRRLPPAAASQPDVSAPAAPPASLPPSPPPPAVEPAADEKVLREQRRTALLLPTRDPFNQLQTSVLSTSRVGPAQQTTLGIEVTGIIIGETQNQNSRMAIVNGKMLEEGMSVAGYTIATIGTNDVTLVNGTNSLTIHVKR